MRHLTNAARLRARKRGLVLSCLVLMTTCSTFAVPGLIEPVSAAELRPIHRAGFPDDRVVYRVHVGDRRLGQFSVSNSRAFVETITIQVVDAAVDVRGRVVFGSPFAAGQDVGQWITLRTESLVLAPGQIRTVQFRVDVPLHTSEGHHLGVILAIAEPAAPPSVNAQLDQRTERPGTDARAKPPFGGRPPGGPSVSALPVVIDVVALDHPPMPIPSPRLPLPRPHPAFKHETDRPDAAVVASNTFEGGTSGTTISTANSGGASRDAFDAVTIGSGAVAAFDNARSAHGTLSGKFSTPSVATTSTVEWSTRIGTLTEVWGRVYYYATASNQNVQLIRILNGATREASVNITTTGKVALVNAAGSTVATGATTIATNKWIRIEFHVIANASTGTIEAKLFNTTEATTATETLTATNTNTGAQFTVYRFGETASVASIGPFWMDDLQVNNTGYPGPSPSATYSVSAPATASLSITLNGSNQTPTFALPLTVTDTTGTSLGWNLTVTATQFINGGGKTLATTASTITSVAVACTTTCVTPVNSVTPPIPVPAGPGPPSAAKFFNADLGTGMGTFTITPTIQVSIPADSFAGAYTCTVTVSISSGP